MAERTTLLAGRRLVNVAGESHYQDALRELTGSDGRDSVRRDFEAVLAPEPDNPFDRNAVKVLIADRLVGYLPRDEASAYGPLLERLAQRGRRGACEAVASRRGGGGTANIGVVLRLPEPDEDSAAPDVGRKW